MDFLVKLCNEDPDATNAIDNGFTRVMEQQAELNNLFEKAGLYDHCRSPGCCGQNMSNIAFTDTRSTFLVAYGILIKEDSQIAYLNSKYCMHFSRKEFSCGLPLRPEACIIWTECIKSHPLMQKIKENSREYIEAVSAFNSIISRYSSMFKAPPLEEIFIMASTPQGIANIKKYFNITQEPSFPS